MSRARLFLSLLALAGLLAGLLPAALEAQEPPVAGEPTALVVVRLYVQDRAHLAAVADQLDVWEVHLQAGYVVAAVTPAQYQWLEETGYRLEVDREKTALLGIQAPLDPRFYYYDNNYPNPNGRYVVSFLQDTHAAFPGLTGLIDIGDAWQAGHGGYHRDMWVLRITNEDPAYGPIADKPAFFLFAGIHAREVATPELAIRYIKYLLTGYNGAGGYGQDPDVTWLVNHNVAYVLVMQNPDGHRVNEAEAGAYRRKNMDDDDGCSSPASWGVDLNRNHSFLWACCGGSSGDPCDETYHGPSAGSEPETQAFESFFTTVMRDQNGPNGDNEFPQAAPITTTGVFLSLHSYSDEVLWPWGFYGYPPAPNDAELTAIGHKFAYFNGYAASGGIGYGVDGATDDWTYGKFGIPSFTFEVGGSVGCGDFFPPYGCLDGIDDSPRSFWAENRPAFLYAHKIARTPYMTIYGPDTTTVTVVPAVVGVGTPVELGAIVSDHRLAPDPLQPVAAAEYFIDAPGTDGSGTAMAPADGAWGETSEEVTATLDTAGLSLGQHYVLVHGRNDSGDWGPFTAVFLYVVDPEVSPTLQGTVRDRNTSGPLAARVIAGPFQVNTDPTTGFYSMLVLSGTYTMTAIASGHVISTVAGIVAQDYQTISRDFLLYPFCDVLNDDAESGNLGWTAQPPWAITTEAAHSPANSWTDSPGGKYSGNLDISLLSPALDLSGIDDVILSFWHIYQTEFQFDYGAVEYSTDGGSTWTRAVRYRGTSTANWTYAGLALPVLDGQANARIRFLLHSDNSVNYDGWHIDDIVLAGGGPGCPQPAVPAALFTSNSPVQLGYTMVFTNETTGTLPLHYRWDFDDGVTSTLKNPTHLYTAPGTFTVTLTATNGLGSRSVSHAVLVEPGPCAPVQGATFSWAPITPTIGQAVVFSGTASGDPPLIYTWDLGDSTVDTGVEVTHVYSWPGVYTVVLTVTNCLGTARSVVQHTVEVLAYRIYLPLVYRAP